MMGNDNVGVEDGNHRGRCSGRNLREPRVCTFESSLGCEWTDARTPR